MSGLRMPRASSVATSRSRAVAPDASRRSVADCELVARSMTIATGAATGGGEGLARLAASYGIDIIGPPGIPD